MFECFENPGKLYEITLANMIAHMLNCHAEGKAIRNLDMKKFTTVQDKLFYKTQQLNRIATTLIRRGLITRIHQGKYAVTDEHRLKDALHDAMMAAGLLAEDEPDHDLLLDIIDPGKPSSRTFFINLLRHMINLHIQQMPIRAMDFNRFSTYQKVASVNNGVHRTFKMLFYFGALKKGVERGVYHVTDLQFIKKMLCDKEQLKGFPPSYPGLVRKINLPKIEIKKAYIRKAKPESASPWHKPPPAWVNMLDSVMGNLGR